MAEDCTDADYLEAYSRFFTEFVAKVNPYDQLPVSVNSYNVTDAEIVGEIINVTLQYLNRTQCPPSLQAHLVHQVIQEVKSMCKKQPKDCGFKSQEKTYTSLKLMQAITGKVNEICTRYLDNSRLTLLPPPPSTPLPHVVAGGNKNGRRKMEDRYVVLHDLHATFGIENDSVANYYAVFDGHGGQDAAVYCATHLHQYLVESIDYPTDPERALRDAFVTTDAQFIEKSKTQKLCGGTTAVCTLLLNKKLYVSWVGDSSAMLIKRHSVVQLVNPHRLHREDEVQRIRKMGGVVMRSMGIMRVNGVLSISRAIGDVRYKPFVTSEPEIKCFPLDGTEDFLVIATDGLTDYLKPPEILTLLYHEIQRDPNGLERAYQILLHWAKYVGSKDNITLVVVLLTPASEIAARPPNAHPLYSVQVGDILEKMNSKEKPLLLDIDDAHNAINSNILKQAIISQEPRDHEGDGILAASNGKHENGDADYDYSDLGPETDVDAIDDVTTMPVKNLSYEFYKDDESGQDEDQPVRDSNLLDNMEKSNNDKKQLDHENNLHEDDEDEVLDETAAPDAVVQEDVPRQTFEEMHEEIRDQMEGSVNDEEAEMKDEERVDDAQDVVDDAGPVDYDDSPPSPRANKPLQHALIPEADNVADSEDSEDEWNYYRVDPNKEKDSTTPVDELQETKNGREVNSPELPVEDIESKIQSSDLEEEEEIKCESPKEELPELIDTEISAEDKAFEPKQEEKLIEEEQEKQKDMDFQLNPDAAEFIPVSPQFMGTRMNLAEDYPISGSPLKQVSEMDDIQVPTESEFEKEVCQRPREVESEDKEYQNGEHLQRNNDTDFVVDRQKTVGFLGNLDDSEISSTKAEFGDESASFLTTGEFHKTSISAVDESFSSSERDYDIAKDPMAMSFTPSDFEAAFEKGVDLNAVHMLSSTDLDDKNGSIEEEELGKQSPEPHPELTTLTSPETEQLTYSSAFPGEPTELVNLSSQQEDSEATFIEHADEPKVATDLLDVQSESFQLEQQETAKSDHSPLTENYSAECESEKEAISVDNEQPLSPSSIDIDETKPIDEASEDAVLPGSDLQKEVSAKETDTPSSLSPVPDAMENDVAASKEDAEGLSSSVQSSLHPDAPEFTPGQYNFHSYAMETDDVCHSSSVETASEVRQSSPTEIAGDVCQISSLAKTAGDVCQISSLAKTAGDVCQISSLAKTAGDVCQISSLAKTAGDVCQISSLAKTAGDVCQSSSMGVADICQSSLLETADDVCESSSVETRDICESLTVETGDISQPTAAEKDDVCKLDPLETSDTNKIIQQDVDVVSQLTEEKIVEPMSMQSAQGQLLDFGEQEEQEVCMRSHIEADLTPPPTPQKLEEEVTEIIDDLVCPIKSAVAEKTEREDIPMETEVLESKVLDIEEPMKEETTLNLSESMQEFTGLEDQLQPKAEERPEVPMSNLILEVPEQIQKTEELKDSIESEKLVESTTEDECKILEEKKVKEIEREAEEIPAAVKEVSETIETAPSVVEAASAVVDTAPSVVETAPSVIETAPSIMEETSAVVEAVSSTVEIPSIIETTSSTIETAPLEVEEAPTTSEITPSVERALSPVELAALVIETPSSTVEAAPSTVETVPSVVETTSTFEAAPSVVEADPAVVEQTISSEVEIVPSTVEVEPPAVEIEPPTVEAVPPTVETISPAVEAVSSVDEIVPSAVEAVPSAVEAVPSAVEAVPSAVEAVPSAVEAVPSTVEAAPSAVEAVSSTVEVFPSAVEAVPTAVEAVPSTVETTPSIVEETPSAVEVPKVEEISSEAKESQIETATEAAESKVAKVAAVATVAAAAVAAGAVATRSEPKVKSAAKPTKTTTSKTAQKSTPTSPSKAVTFTTKSSTSSAEKPSTTTTARPKGLDASKKTTMSSPVTNKTSAAKPASKTTTTSSSPATKSTAKSSVSAAPKPKPATSTPKTTSDKKPTTSGEVKSLSKPTTAKPLTNKVSSPAKTSLVKAATSSTRTSTGATTTTKPRAASATTASRPRSTVKPITTTTTTTAARPKTAPIVGNATKPRILLTVKSPLIDKQVKETANKQISMAPTSTTAKTSRLSSSGTTTTKVKCAFSSTKTTTTASPTKKLSATSKVSSKVSTGGKTTTSEKGKVLQNGVSENVEINTIIDDVPKKDLSPVVTPNDNQLIMSSD